MLSSIFFAVKMNISCTTDSNITDSSSTDSTDYFDTEKFYSFLNELDENDNATRLNLNLSIESSAWRIGQGGVELSLRRSGSR
jgi:hypothetical protein